jgi:hypothetical protein
MSLKQGGVAPLSRPTLLLFHISSEEQRPSCSRVWRANCFPPIACNCSHVSPTPVVTVFIAISMHGKRDRSALSVRPERRATGTAPV